MASPDDVAEAPPEPSYRRKILSSLAWQGSAQFLGQLVSWASTIVVMNLLFAGDYGLMAMATVFVAFILMLSDLGIGAAIVQAEELDDDDLAAIQAFVSAFNLVGFVVTLAASPILAWFYQEPALVWILVVLSANFLLIRLYLVPQSRLIRDLRFDKKAKVDLVTLVLSAATALAVAWMGFGVWALVAGTMMTHLARAVGFNIVVRDHVAGRWSMERGRRFLRFGSYVVADRLLWFAYSNLDIVIAGRLLGASLTGLYSVALTFAAMPLDKIMPVLIQVAFPAVAKIQNEPERVRHNMIRAFRYGNLVFLPVFWGMALVAPDVFELLLEPKWQSSVILFQMICVILPLKALGALFTPALFGIGRPEVNVSNMAISLVLLTAGFFVGSQWGVVGLAASWLVVFPIVFSITTTRALPAIGLRWIELLGALRGSFVAAAVMAAAVWGVIEAGAAWPLVARLVVSIAVGAASYVAMMFAFDRGTVDEVRELVARRRGQPAEG